MVDKSQNNKKSSSEASSIRKDAKFSIFRKGEIIMARPSTEMPKAPRRPPKNTD